MLHRFFFCDAKKNENVSIVFRAPWTDFDDFRCILKLYIYTLRKNKFWENSTSENPQKTFLVVPIWDLWTKTVQKSIFYLKSLSYQSEMTSKSLFCDSKSFSIILWCLENTFRPKLPVNPMVFNTQISFCADPEALNELAL